MSPRSHADTAPVMPRRERSALQVLVIGEALIDIVQNGHDSAEHVGGSPANVALGLGRRGIPVGLLSQLGNDSRGRMIIDHLEASGVTVLDESLTGASTSTARASIQPDGQAVYDFDIEWGCVRPPLGIAARVIHTGSIASFLAPGAASVLELLREADAPEITFDPNIRPALVGRRSEALGAYESFARVATVVKMSDQDAEWLHPGATIDQVADELLALGPALVALTMGERGALIATARHRLVVPGMPVTAVDTIGAGDTFMSSVIRSVLAHGSAGLDLPTLERLGRDAVHAASLTVSRAGADLPWQRELEAAEAAAVV